MAQVHLSHIIDWNAIAKCYYDLPGKVILPVGPCDRIHLIDRQTEIKVEMRGKYITEEMICHNEECISQVKASKDRAGMIKYKSFKKDKDAPGFNNFPHLAKEKVSEEYYKNLVSFFRSWVEAIDSFVDSEKQKFSEEAMKEIRKNPPTDEFLRNLVLETTRLRDVHYSESDQSPLIYTLITTNNLSILKYFNDEKRVDVAEEFRTKVYGSQFSNYRYIEFYLNLFSMYFSLNVMIQMGIKEVNPNVIIHNYYFNTVRSIINLHKSMDRDFDDFEIPVNLHPFLVHGVLFNDGERTRTLLKSLFRLIVNIYAVRRFILNENIKYHAFVDAFNILFSQEIYEDELLLRIGKDIGVIE